MSLTARIHHLKDVATGIGWKVLRAVAPVVSDLAGRVQSTLQSRLAGDASGSTTTPGAPAAEPPDVEPATPPPAEPAASPESDHATGDKPEPGPNPATVARNIAPHPPAPAPATPESAVPKAVPGDKLPPRRRSDEE